MNEIDVKAMSATKTQSTAVPEVKRLQALVDYWQHEHLGASRELVDRIRENVALSDQLSATRDMLAECQRWLTSLEKQVEILLSEVEHLRVDNEATRARYAEVVPASMSHDEVVRRVRFGK